MTPRLTLAQLRVFVAVAEAGSFGAAAADLDMSQSSLSEGVQGLERVVGRPLLRRTPAGIQLTEAGERALEHARRILGAAGDLLLAVDEVAALTGTLKVATYRSLGVHVLPPVLAALRRLHPQLDVRVLDGENDGEGGQRYVQDGRADVGLLQLSEHSPLLTWPLLEDEYLAVFPAARGRQPVSWAELTVQPLLLPPSFQSCYVNVKTYLTEHIEPLGPISEGIDDDVILFDGRARAGPQRAAATVHCAAAAEFGGAAAAGALVPDPRGGGQTRPGGAAAHPRFY